MIFPFLKQRPGIDNNAGGTLDIYTNRKGKDAPLPPSFVASIFAWEKETRVDRFTRVTVRDAEDCTGPLPLFALSPQPNS
jgi:hypothetical protein